MELIEHLQLGLSVAATPENIVYCFIGVLLGTAIGILPGFGPIPTIAILLPLTYALTPVAALIMLAGIYYGAQYGGSTTAILVNMPGESSSVITCIDGYKMARNGRAASALAISAIGSFFAGTVATLVLAALAMPLASWALNFGAPEYFSLILLGLIGAICLSSGSLTKSMGMAVLGLILGCVGTDLDTGMLRFDFGLVGLIDGIDFVIIAMAFFGLTEVIHNLSHPEDRTVLDQKLEGWMPTRQELTQSANPILRGTIIGSVLGVLPGGGALLAAFTSYIVERRVAKDPSRFGNGAIEGVAGPEAANNAASQTSFIPMLTLGLPSNPVMALMIGAMMIQNIQPGPQVASTNPDLFWGLIASMWIGNLMLLVLNLPLVGVWAKLLAIRYRHLFPCIILFCIIGVYSVMNATFDVYLLAVFLLVGYLLTLLECPPAPLLLGFVLGPMLEENFRRALSISNGDYMTFLQSPISVTLLVVAGISVAFVATPRIRARREDALAE